MTNAKYHLFIVFSK